jgi:hypothetical protein
MKIEPEMYPWLSAAALAWGLVDCFFGYRVFKFTVALLGAVAGAVFGQAAGAAMDLGRGGELGGLLLGALLGGGLAFLLYLAAVFLAGFGFGATLGMLLLANYHHTVAVISGIVLGLIGGIVAVKLQRVLLILSTATLGAFRAVLAAGYFTDRLDWFYYYQRPDQIPALIDSTGWTFPVIIVLAAAGAIAQFELGGKGGGEKKKDKPAKD